MVPAVVEATVSPAALPAPTLPDFVPLAPSAEAEADAGRRLFLLLKVDPRPPCDLLRPWLLLPPRLPRLPPEPAEDDPINLPDDALPLPLPFLPAPDTEDAPEEEDEEVPTPPTRESAEAGRLFLRSTFRPEPLPLPYFRYRWLVGRDDPVEGDAAVPEDEAGVPPFLDRRTDVAPPTFEEVLPPPPPPPPPCQRPDGLADPRLVRDALLPLAPPPKMWGTAGAEREGSSRPSLRFPSLRLRSRMETPPLGRTFLRLGTPEEAPARLEARGCALT